MKSQDGFSRLTREAVSGKGGPFTSVTYVFVGVAIACDIGRLACQRLTRVRYKSVLRFQVETPDYIFLDSFAESRIIARPNFSGT